MLLPLRLTLPALALLLAACGASPPAAPPPAAPQPPPPPVASAEAEPERVEPEPPRATIRRYHVYARIRSRWQKMVRLLCLLRTSETDELEIGTEAQLQRQAEETDTEGLAWIPVAEVRVTKLGQGGNTRLEIVAEHPEAKLKGKSSPWVKGTRVRLQIDLPIEPES